jgi:non-canonical poly(A) RNA polymerase PAPD5/7
MLDIGQTGNAIEHSYFDAEAGATYRPLSELSDDDEADMDISENEDNGETSQEPSTKRARLSVNQSAADGDSVPKWSNPDPYTALPPPDAASRQRKDVVQLIRKARVQTKESRQSLLAETEDFIPCIDSSEDESDSEGEVNATAAGGPSAPMQPSQPAGTLSRGKASTSDESQAREAGRNSFTAINSDNNPRDSLNDSQSKPAHPLPPKPVPVQSLPPRPSQAYTEPNEALPKAQPAANAGSTSLYTRKRTIDDEIKLPPHARLKKFNKMPVGGTHVWEWKVKSGEEPCPWVTTDHSNTTNMGVW